MSTKIRPHFVASHMQKAQVAFVELTNIYKNYPLNEANVIIVLGGDGYLLRCIHEFCSYNIPIFGMNRGSVGFLLNCFKLEELTERINNSHKIKLNALEFIATSSNNQMFKGFAFNEITLFRMSGQAVKLRIDINEKTKIETLMGDGALVSTPAGSTAYNMACDGSILPLNADVINLTAINPFKPRFKGAILTNNTNIKLVNLSPDNRPTLLTADNIEIPHIKSVDIFQSEEIFCNLLFDPEQNLHERIMRQQFELPLTNT